MQYNEIMEKTNTMQEVPPEIRCRKYHQKYDAGSTTRDQCLFFVETNRLVENKTVTVKSIGYTLIGFIDYICHTQIAA